MKNVINRNLETYIIELSNYGKFKIKESNVFYALDKLRVKRNLEHSSINVTQVFIFKSKTLLIDITEFINQHRS